GAAVSFKGLWAERTVVLAFVRHLGCIFCRQQVAGLTKRLPEIERRGATLVVVAPAKPEHIGPFRQATGYAGALYVDRSGRAFRTAGLVRGSGTTHHLRAVLKGVVAFAKGFRQAGRPGAVVQQGGAFVLGPGDRVHYEWRDRFAGDNANLDAVVGAIPSTAAGKGGTTPHRPPSRSDLRVTTLRA